MIKVKRVQGKFELEGLRVMLTYSNFKSLVRKKKRKKKENKANKAKQTKQTQNKNRNIGL